MRVIISIAALVAVLSSPVFAARLPVYSDRELTDGFMRTVFGSENIFVARSARNRVSKFSGPVRVRVVDLARARNNREVKRFISDLNRKVPRLSISTTRSKARANYEVILVRRADYKPVIRQYLPKVRTGFLERAACSGIAFLRPDGSISNAMAFVVVDEGRHLFRHCMVEEILQGLGPSNDSAKLAHSIFNDRNGGEAFLPFDQLLINMLYDPRIKPGMSRRDVRAVLPAVIRDIRK